MTLSTSSVASLRAPWPCSSTTAEKARMMTPSPATMKKRSCQVALSMMRPAAVGPSAGAKPMTRPYRPMAVPRFSTGNMSMSSVITRGIMTPSPAACTRRPARMVGKLGPQPAMAEPAVKMAMATRNRLRIEKRSMRNAVMGIMMAFTSVKPVVSHCAVEASTFVSIMMEGSAGVTSVWLSTAMNVPKIITTSMSVCLRVSPSNAICASSVLIPRKHVAIQGMPAMCAPRAEKVVSSWMHAQNMLHDFRLHHPVWIQTSR